jgi:hypothetical protein
MQKYLIYNATDNVYAYPDPVTRAEALRIIRALRAAYKRQGYYASVAGHIPVAALRYRLIPAL